MFDPFPTENAWPTVVSSQRRKSKIKKVSAKQQAEQLVYPREMYIDGFSPWVKYFPTDEMFFKLMRGSLDIPDVTKLWFIEQSDKPKDSKEEEQKELEKKNKDKKGNKK